MNKDEIKKALKYCQDYDYESCVDCPYRKHSEDCTNDILKDALKLINGQEKEIEFQVQDRARLQRKIDELEQAHEQRVEEIERLKVENEEKCWECIEAKRVTAEDYAKLQEEFANYQLASDKEIRAQVKQAKIDVLNRLKERYGFYSCCSWMCVVKSLTEIIDEFIKEIEE